jgi:hypothetical protein
MTEYAESASVNWRMRKAKKRKNPSEERVFEIMHRENKCGILH